ncbi:hypothetical protein BH18ACT12_BH18ACT12_18500 [soil metagenome]
MCDQKTEVTLSLALDGSWWCPEDPEGRVGGTLNASFEHIELSLLGALPARPDAVSALGLALDPSAETVRVIHGAAGGKCVSLFDCRTLRVEVGPGARQQLHAGTALVGAHVSHIRSSRMQISFEGLGEWAGLVPPRLQHIDVGGRIDLSLERLGPAEARLDSGVVRVVFASNLSRERQAVTLYPSVSIAVQLPSSMHLSDLMKAYVSPLQGLLALATGRAAAVDHLTVQPDDSEPDRPCQVFFDAIVAPGRESHDVRREEFFFVLDSLRDRFTEHLERWFASYENLRTAYDVFFFDVYAPARFIDTRFLLQCQLAEVLHRRRFALRTETLRKANRVPLQDRVRELIELAPSAARRRIGDIAAFAARVAQVRNHYTHRSTLPSGRRPDGAETLLLHLTAVRCTGAFDAGARS